MAISQPTSSDKQNSPDHSLMHRQIATDPSTLENGMMWMESDGLHIYRGNTEYTIAGA
jgi:hypothetical protein